MNLTLTEAERAQLRVLQKQRRDEAGYVKVTVVLLLDRAIPRTAYGFSGILLA